MTRSFIHHSFQLIGFHHVRHQAAASGTQINDDSHLIHLAKGTGTLITGDIRSRLTAFAVASVPPFTEFTIELDAGTEMLNLHFHLRHEDGASFDECVRLPWVFKPVDPLNIEKKLRDLDAIWRDADLIRQARAAAIAHDVALAHLATQPLTPANPDDLDARARSLRAALTSSLHHPFDARKIAGDVGLSVSQLNRVFKSRFKTSPRKFWEQRRLLSVQAALSKNAKTLAEIADDHAFHDDAHFSRWFKKITGTTPSKYRRDNPWNEF